MQKISQLVILFFLLVITPLVYSAALESSPVGYWKTIDDVTGKPKSILQISQTASGTLAGRVMKVFPGPEVRDTCVACKGDLHNKPIVGMVVMTNMKKSKDNPLEWSGGEILDPKNGKTYHCTLQVIDNGQKLKVRGYIGVPLFGRTQTWLRVSGPKAT